MSGLGVCVLGGLVWGGGGVLSGGWGVWAVSGCPVWGEWVGVWSGGGSQTPSQEGAQEGEITPPPPTQEGAQVGEPPLNRHTPVKKLPSPILSMRSVIKLSP